jgi:hypothetical protein
MTAARAASQMTPARPASQPSVTICIPHWQAELFIKLCLRSIRRHSEKYALEVIVVDNGSRDASLDYLRSLDWIRLIERPEEVHTNWPDNVFTAWNRGLEEARGEYFVTMHSDVFVRRDGWLDPLLRDITRDPSHAASGSWKLDLENPLYAWQKRVIGYASGKVRSWLGVGKPARWQTHNFPRDYCAMYRRRVVLGHGLTFCGINGYVGGGYSIAQQLWDAGFQTPVFPVREMAGCVFHVAHGTAAIAPEKRLRHAHKQKQTERKVARLLASDWIQDLARDDRLDRSATAKAA